MKAIQNLPDCEAASKLKVWIVAINFLDLIQVVKSRLGCFRQWLLHLFLKCIPTIKKVSVPDRQCELSVRTERKEG
jgi:hypothetical protein